MDDNILFEGQNQIRLTIFLLSFALFAGLESLRPLRKRKSLRIKRWRHHFGLILSGNLLIKLIMPIGTLFWAQYLHEKNLGLLSVVQASYLFKMISALIILDLAIYTQHLILHKVSWLWRLHRVHHYDVEFDVSTAIRFHPLEIIFSQIIKMIIIALIGAPVLSVFLFEIILSTTSLFNHSNISLPQKLDSFLRVFLVTPDMHRVHHSIYSVEMQSNFGFNLPIWDHLFRTYKACPLDGHKKMRIGLKDFRASHFQNLKALLINPFLKEQD